MSARMQAVPNPENDDANTLSARCRPGLFLSSDDSGPVRRQCGVLAWPDRANRYRLSRLLHHQGASAEPVSVDTGERRLLRPTVRVLMRSASRIEPIVPLWGGTIAFGADVGVQKRVLRT